MIYEHIIILLAASRIIQLVQKDSITDEARRILYNLTPSIHDVAYYHNKILKDGVVEPRKKLPGKTRCFIGTLVSCKHCLSVWVITVLYFLYTPLLIPIAIMGLYSMLVERDIL